MYLKNLTLLSILTPLACLSANNDTIVFDLANPQNKSVLIDKNLTEIQVKLKNVPPRLSDAYSVDIEFNKVSAPALTRPTASTQPKALIALAPKCPTTGDPKTFVDAINNATQPSVVKTTISAALQNNNISKQCIDHVVESTVITHNISLKSDYNVSIAVSDSSKVLSKYELSKPTQNFLTHIGFTFVANKGKQYYSKPNITGDNTQYVITEQANQDDVLYAASALFTYPIGSFFNAKSTDWGWTAGLSANQDTVAVSFGPSLIIADNILLNVGAIFQEFDELSGTYSAGDVITGDPIDSSALSKSAFKLSYGITIGFNFGD